MQNAFLRWLSGTPPHLVGAWWDEAAVCLVHVDHSDVLPRVTCSYEPVVSVVPSLEPYQNSGLKNALRVALERLGLQPVRLALGVPSAEVFTKTTSVPLGLNDKELAQLCLVEAVVNLPIPPEEVCADFLCEVAPDGETQAPVKIAFCRREIVDELILTAEDAGVSLAIVDRNIQAIHDATLWLTQAGEFSEGGYPFAILVETEPISLIVALNELDLVSYVISNGDIDLTEQIGLCVRRSGVAANGLMRIVVLQNPDSAPVDIADMKAQGVECSHLDPLGRLELPRDIPVSAFMTALGMGLRHNP